MVRLHFVLLAIVVAGLLAWAAHAADFLVQTVTVNDGGTAVSTALTANTQYSIQCSGTTHYKVCATSNCVAAGTDWSVPSAGMDLGITQDNAGASAGYVSIVADGGSSSCGIYKVIPATLPGFPGQ